MEYITRGKLRIIKPYHQTPASSPLDHSQHTSYGFTVGDNNYKTSTILFSSITLEILMVIFVSIIAVASKAGSSFWLHAFMCLFFFISGYRHAKRGYFIAAAMIFVSIIMYAYSLAMMAFFEIAYDEWLSVEGNLAKNWMSQSGMTVALHMHLLFLGTLFVCFTNLPENSNRHFFVGYKGSSVKGALILSLVIAAILGIVNPRPPMVFGVGYHSTDYLNQYFLFSGRNIAGIETIMMGLFVMAFYLAFTRYFANRFFFFVLALIFLEMAFFTLFRGSRSATFISVMSITAFYIMFSHSKYKTHKAVVMLLFVFWFLQLWANFRWHVGFNDLIDAVVLSFEEMFTFGGQEPTVLLIKIERLPQLYWNILVINTLVESGNYLMGDSFFSMLGQAVPSFIAEAIGYTRPLDTAWVLARSVEHGGGIYGIAEAYWNFGLSGVVIWGILLSLLVRAIEVHFDKYLAGPMTQEGFYKGLSYFPFLGLPITLMASLNTQFRFAQLMLLIYISITLISKPLNRSSRESLNSN